MLALVNLFVVWIAPESRMINLLLQMILVGRCEQLVLEFEMIDQPELLVVHRYALSDTRSFLIPALQLQLQQQLRSELLLADVHWMHP